MLGLKLIHISRRGTAIYLTIMLFYEIYSVLGIGFNAQIFIKYGPTMQYLFTENISSTY